MKYLPTYRWADILHFSSLVLIYALLAHLVLMFASTKGNVTIFWLPGGIALAALLIGGRRCAPAIFIGAFIAGIQINDPPITSLAIAIGNTLESLLATYLLRRIASFDDQLSKIEDFLSIAWVACISALCSALIGPFALWQAGFLNLDTLGINIFYWWQADVLGIILGTPLLLVWQKKPNLLFNKSSLLKSLVFFVCTFTAGQIIFLDWFHDLFGNSAMGYWMFLFVVYAAVWFGRHGTLLIISMTAIQALLGIANNIGYFADDLAQTKLENFWFYLLILTVVGVSLAINIEARNKNAQDLQDSESRFRLFLNHNPLIAWIKDEFGRYQYINQPFAKRFAQQFTSNNDWQGKDDYQLWPKATADQFRNNDLAVLSEWQTKELIEETLDDQGQPLHWMIIKFPIQDSQGKKFIAGLGLDISNRKKAEEKLKLNAKVFENTLEGIMISDVHNKIIDVNLAFTRITGYTRDEVIGKDISIIKSEHHDAHFYDAIWQTVQNNGHWSGELWSRRKDGELYPEWLSISAITDEIGNVSHYVGISADITVLKRHEKQLEHIAHYDALTGIPNRILLVDRIQQALSQSKREQKLLAICYLDLDGFKPINDTLGHEEGDKVLIEIAQRIGGALRGGDTVARLGGDEFVILLLNIETLSDCSSSLDRLLKVIAKPITLQSELFTVTASIGVTLYPNDNEDPDTLMRHADQAMYIAKQTGKNRFHIYDPNHDVKLKQHHEHRIRVGLGILAKEFELFYQPKINLQSNQIIGFEALIRWRIPDRGLLLPDEFLPDIENCDLEIKIGNWVIEDALSQIANWLASGLDTNISINIAASHLQAPDFVDSLRQHLIIHPQVRGDQLQIEILETVALADIGNVAKIIEACAHLGVKFALDDFGTGYSSLSYLRRLPADTLKIDQSFIRNMLVDHEDRAIVEGVIALARTFNRITVAEGVETPQHFQILKDMQCDIAQGYGIARPMPASEVLNWCDNFNKKH